MAECGTPGAKTPPPLHVAREYCYTVIQLLEWGDRNPRIHLHGYHGSPVHQEAGQDEEES